jgi:UDP-2,3-diacylglucosamine hydrolase
VSREQAQASALPPVLAVERIVDPLIDPIVISDLHLTTDRPRTVARFLRFMQQDAPGHPELLILGDLFDFWIGDDAGAGAAPIVEALAAATRRGQRLLVMHGNRDPLLGSGFANATGATLLADPLVVDVSSTRTLLTHGDAWCTLDVAYQQMRATLRQPEFQSDFLARPLADRVAFARSLRMQSESEKAVKAADIMDVTPDAVLAAVREAGVRRVIHGHTHRPAAHVVDIDGGRVERWVLPDWDLDDVEPRGGFLDFVEGQPRLVFFDD